MNSAWAIFGNDVPLVKPTLFNSTTVIPDDQKYWAEPLLRALTSNPKRTNEWIIRLTENMAADIFVGQIVACVVVVIFVCLFFLREWVIQNAHPGVLEDAPQGVEGDVGANAAAVDLDGVVDLQQQELLLAEIQRKNEEAQHAEPEHQTPPTVLVEQLKGVEDVAKDDQQAAVPVFAVQTTSPNEENQIRVDVAEPPESIQHGPPTRRKTRPPTPDITSWATAISSQATFPLPNGTVVASPLSPPPMPQASPLGLNFDYAEPPFNRVVTLNPTSKPQPFPPWVATPESLAQRDLGGKRTTFKVLSPKPRIRAPETTTQTPTATELATTAKSDIVPPTWLAPNDQWKFIFEKIANDKPTIQPDTFLPTSPSATSKRVLEKTRAFDVPVAGSSTSTPTEAVEEPFQLAPPIDPATLVKITSPFRFGSPTSNTASFTFGVDARKPRSDPLMEVLNEMTEGNPPVNKFDLDWRPSLSLSARGSAHSSPSRRTSPPFIHPNPLTDAVTGTDRANSPLGSAHAEPSFDSIPGSCSNPCNNGHSKNPSTSSTSSSTFFHTPSTPHGATNPRTLPAPGSSSSGFSLYAQRTDTLLSFQSIQSLAPIDPPWSTLGKDKSNPIVIRPSPELGPTKLPRDPSPPTKEFDLSAYQFPRASGILLDVPSSTNTETGSNTSSADNTPPVPAHGLRKTPPPIEPEAKEPSNTSTSLLTERRNQQIGPLSIPPMQSTRRPGLPYSAGQDVIEGLTSSMNGTPTRPLPSPSIALYRPPEDVLASPSSVARLPPEGMEELDLYFPIAPMKGDPVGEGGVIDINDAPVPVPPRHVNDPGDVAPALHEAEAPLDDMEELVHQAPLLAHQEDEFAQHEAVLDLEDEQAEEADAAEPVEVGNAPQAGNQLLEPPLVMDDEPFGDDEMVNALEGRTKTTYGDCSDPFFEQLLEFVVLFMSSSRTLDSLFLSLIWRCSSAFSCRTMRESTSPSSRCVVETNTATKPLIRFFTDPSGLGSAHWSISFHPCTFLHHQSAQGLHFQLFTLALCSYMSAQVFRSVIYLAVASYAAFTIPLATFDSHVTETMALFDERLSSFFDFGRVTSIFRVAADPLSSGYEAINTLLSPLLQRSRYYAPPSLINSVDMTVKAWRLVIPIDGTARASSAMCSVDASARQIMQLVATDPSYAIAFGWSIILLGIFVYSKATRLRSAALILKLVKVYPPLKGASYSLTYA